jgi:hypothetical protein
MKTLQRLCAAFVLTLALAASAFAGDMTTMITGGSTQDETQTAVAGEIQTGITATTTEIALNLILNVLSIV